MQAAASSASPPPRWRQQHEQRQHGSTGAGGTSSGGTSSGGTSSGITSGSSKSGGGTGGGGTSSGGTSSGGTGSGGTSGSNTSGSSTSGSKSGGSTSSSGSASSGGREQSQHRGRPGRRSVRHARTAPTAMGPPRAANAPHGRREAQERNRGQLRASDTGVRGSEPPEHAGTKRSRGECTISMLRNVSSFAKRLKKTLAAVEANRRELLASRSL
jgi:hypothetical protein